jgi:cbb3-type cytochrome oxidase maturation protein
MDILFLLIPVSVLLALAVMGLLGWAVWAGQFEDMEVEGRRILETEVMADGDSVANTEAH